MHVVTLKTGREKSLRHRHPWVFSGAIDSVSGEPQPGEVVELRDARGVFLARGYYNAQSRIRVRVLSWDDRAIDDAFWRERLSAAIARRGSLAADPGTSAYRLVHAEADLLPGLIADRYGDVVVVQLLTAGVERARDVVVDALAAETGARCVFERSDTASRVREGLAASVRCVHGDVAAAESVTILENGLRFEANVAGGQKTGFYLDQRANRARVAALAAGRSVLDVFCNSGAFGIAALRSGAVSAAYLDSSAPALQALERNLDLNGLGDAAHEVIHADAFEALRSLRDAGRRFGLVVLDPPKFAVNRHQLDKAMRAYKDVNLLAMELLEAGGVLATFSCSQAVDIANFSMAVSWAAVDARRDVQVVERLGQAADHPVLASFPESEYLKGLLCRVL